MQTRPSNNVMTTRILPVLGLAMALSSARAQNATAPVDAQAAGWERYGWLQASKAQQRQAASGTSVTANATQDVKDPYSVITTGSLWQEKYDAVYTRRIGDTLSLSCESRAVALTDAAGDLSEGQQAGFQLVPGQELTLGGNIHNSTNDAASAVDSSQTTGAGFSAAGHLPSNTLLTLDMNSDRSGLDSGLGGATTDTTYNAQLQRPVGNLPLSAIFKGRYEQIGTPSAPASSLPSMEQSLVWKPAQDTSVQAGLRQQHFQAFPGDTNDFNEALFADFSQKIVGDVTWHSYAEVLGSRTTDDAAPVAPIASGANGTGQASASTGKSPLAMPSLDDTSLTFSTGPSFQLQKDISASFEYSNRWDKNPTLGNVGPEQRISVSVKGTF